MRMTISFAGMVILSVAHGERKHAMRKVLKIAGITFDFHSSLPIDFGKEMQLFAAEPENICDYTCEIILAELPAMPECEPACTYANMKRWNTESGCLSFYRNEMRQWSICRTEAKDKNAFYIQPDHVAEVKDIWNIFSKIEFSSRLLEHGAVMLHSSYLIYDGQAILFTAASGVGKSTQAELWRKTLGAEVINGDRSIIREKDGRLWAFGTPYSGTSGICKNVSAPIRAIVTLEQAPENTVRPLTRKECTRFFLAQTTIQRWKPEDVIGTIELWDSFIMKVPVLRLACRPDEDAVYTLKNYLDTLDKEEKPL